MDHARRWDRQLRRLLRGGVVPQEHKRVGEDRVRQRDPADLHRGRRVVVLLAGCVAELDVEALTLDLAYAPQRIDEVHVPGRAAQLAVGDALQAGHALALDQLRDRGVLDRSQPGVVKRPSAVVGSGTRQLGRAQQAADVVGAERGCRANGHVERE